MRKIQVFVNEKILPLTQKLGKNKALNAITAGMMATMPLSLGTSVVAIVANFPVKEWTTWLNTVGIKVHMAAIIGGTTEIIALFLAFLIAYNYASEIKTDKLTSGVLSLGVFMILMPQTVVTEEGVILSAITRSYMGSTGIFVAIFVGLLTVRLYAYLKGRGLYIKLPDSVPDMVAQSLSPAFISMIIFIVVVFVRFGFGLTEYGNAFDYVSKIIAQPLMSIGTSPVSLIGLYMIINLAWCFGIHPSAIASVILPILYTGIAANVAAFQSGQILPFLEYIIVYKYINTGGTGNTLGLALNMTFFSKSERFKTLGKLAIIPNLFNINEPIIFGAPVLYNPIFMVPMVLSAVVSGGLGMLLVRMGLYASFNPTVSVPWTTPAPINHLLTTGVYAALGCVVVIIASAIVYYPFFKLADKLALKEESNKKVVEA